MGSEYRPFIARRARLPQVGRFVGREAIVPMIAGNEGDTHEPVFIGRYGYRLDVNVPIAVVALVKNDLGLGVEMGSQFPELPEC